MIPLTILSLGFPLRITAPHYILNTFTKKQKNIYILKHYYYRNLASSFSTTFEYINVLCVCVCVCVCMHACIYWFHLYTFYLFLIFFRSSFEVFLLNKMCFICLNQCVTCHFFSKFGLINMNKITFPFYIAIATNKTVCCDAVDSWQT